MRSTRIKIIVLVCVFCVFGFVGWYTALAGRVLAKADDACLQTPNDPSCESYYETNCNNPSSRAYTTSKCVEKRLGLKDISADTILVPRDPNSVIVVVFRLLIAVVILAAVARGVIIGFQLASTGDDSEKRKKLFVNLVSSLVGLVVGLGSLGLTYIIQYTFFGSRFDDQVFKCSDLPENASQELKDRCKLYIDK